MQVNASQTLKEKKQWETLFSLLNHLVVRGKSQEWKRHLKSFFPAQEKEVHDLSQGHNELWVRKGDCFLEEKEARTAAHREKQWFRGEITVLFHLLQLPVRPNTERHHLIGWTQNWIRIFSPPSERHFNEVKVAAMTQVSKGYACIPEGQQEKQLWEERGALIRLIG